LRAGRASRSQPCREFANTPGSFVKRRRSQSAAATLTIVSGCSRPECKVQVEMAATTVGEWHSYLVP
jgi:hypothetical protein